MDFASLLSAEISKSSSPSSKPTSNKFLKRAEAEAKREEEYKREQEALERQREEKAAQKRKREEEEAERNLEREEKRRKLAEESRRRREEEEEQKERARRKRLGLPDLPSKMDNDGQGTPVPEGDDIPDDALIEKLRTLNEPITLFGEAHLSRLKRYCTLTAKTLTPVPKSNGPIPTILEPVADADMLVSTTMPTNAEEKTYLFRQITSYFNMLFSAWTYTLATRDAETKASTTGKAASVTLQQTITALRPLFTKFETSNLEDSILRPLLKIVRAMQERRYVAANDGYLRLSIGKAAWPIGVTMVGIHERSAREKLHEDGKEEAHIMSDEITRKFLQGIKRCLSFAQTRWPPEDFGQLMG